MNKTKTTILLFFTVIGSYLLLASFLAFKEPHTQKRNALLKVTHQPDLALSTEADFIRNRSLATIFTTFKESPELPEYSPSSFVFSPKSVQ